MGPEALFLYKKPHMAHLLRHQVYNTNRISQGLLSYYLTITYQHEFHNVDKHELFIESVKIQSFCAEGIRHRTSLRNSIECYLWEQVPDGSARAGQSDLPITCNVPLNIRHLSEHLILPARHFVQIFKTSKTV